MKKYNVFTDFHHASLLHSLILLFEGRWGGNVYRPIGMEWAEQGYWHVYDHPATQQQFLTTAQGYRPIDGTPPLNEIIDSPQPGVYYCRDIDSGKFNKAITLDKFFELPIDIVIASIPQHIEPFKKLCELHPNKPKMIFQIGNAWTVEAGLAPNIMASAIIHGVPEEINFIQYHQEFDTNIFKPEPNMPMPGQTIYSFVNCFNIMGHFAQDWQLFQDMETMMKDWTFKSYGGQCRDGAVGPDTVLAQTIRDARFVWHTKYAGDGYGHIIHNVPAVGRPLIVKKAYYQDKLADPLLVDGVTCIAIDGLTPGDILEKINYYSMPERYVTLCNMAYENFKTQVNFEKEAERLALFMENLK